MELPGNIKQRKASNKKERSGDREQGEKSFIFFFFSRFQIQPAKEVSEKCISRPGKEREARIVVRRKITADQIRRVTIGIRIVKKRSGYHHRDSYREKK